MKSYFREYDNYRIKLLEFKMKHERLNPSFLSLY